MFSAGTVHSTGIIAWSTTLRTHLPSSDVFAWSKATSRGLLMFDAYNRLLRDVVATVLHV